VRRSFARGVEHAIGHRADKRVNSVEVAPNIEMRRTSGKLDVAQQAFSATRLRASVIGGIAE
jgi:hypothetical protein